MKLLARHLILGCSLVLISSIGLAQSSDEPTSHARNHRAAMRTLRAELTQRLQNVRENSRPEDVEDIVQQARRALGRAMRSIRDEQPIRAERALAIAEASIILAERKAAFRATERRLEEARRQHEEASERETRAREAVQQAESARVQETSSGAHP